MSMRTTSRIAIALLILAIPSAAFATTMDFYVYGGFDAVVNAFSKLALIFGDSTYKSLYAISIVAGIFFGCLSLASKALGTGNGSPMAWLVPSLIGIMVYLALVVPKGTLQIYDPVYNKNQALGSIPEGVVVVAGLLNTIERGLVEIVSTSGDPMSYQTQAGGKGFLGLAQLTSLPLSASDSNLDASLRRYVKDCVTYELMRPGSSLSVDELRKTTTSFTSSMQKAQNPAVWTVYYDSLTPNGQTLTCTDAWTNITAALTPASLSNNISAVCASLGYDVTDAASLNQCKTVLENVNDGTTLGAASLYDFLKQAYISQRLEEVFRSGDATGATNYQFLLSASGAMKAANEWLPILRAVLTAIAVGLVPFLALFIPTPFIGKAVGLIAGLFVWLTAWGVTDAIVHQFAVDYANKTYELVRQNRLGMDALYFFPDQTVKILGMFGTLRMSGMMLATVITGMLVKFGGHAMAMMSGSLAGQIQSAGTRAAHEIEDPAGRASAIQRNVSAMPAQAWANEHSFWSRSSAAKSHMDMNTGSGLALGTEGFSQGYNSMQTSMGTTDAFVKSGDPRASAALGTAMMKAPTGQFSTNAGQEWIRHASPDGKIATLTSGAQKLALSNGRLTDASGMHLGIKYNEGIKAGYSVARSNAESEAVRYDMATGRSFLSTLSNNEGTTSVSGIAQKYGVSKGTTHELNKTLANTASIIGNKSTAIRDEHGNLVSKEALGQFIVSAEAGTPFGSIAPIKVSGSARGGYQISATTKEGTTHTYTVDVADKKGVERSVGEAWRDTTSRLRSTELSANDQKAISEMLQVSKTESSTSQAGQAWNRAKTLERKETEETSHAVQASQDYDAALIGWYGDKYYGNVAPEQRYTEAASDLNLLATRADKGAINKVFGDFIEEKMLAPDPVTVRGDQLPVEVPGVAPESLERVPQLVAETNSRIEAGRDGMNRPQVIPGNIRERIATSFPSASLGKPNPQLKRYLNLMKENVETGGKEMERVTASIVGPLAQMAPFIPIVSPTARGAGDGRLPDNKITDFDPKVMIDTFKSAGDIFKKSGIGKSGIPSKFTIGGRR